MIEVQSFTFNPFQENTYLLINSEKDCWIVDPGMYEASEHELVTEFISREGLTPRAIMNTHTHTDHIFGVQAMKERYSIPFLAHRDDLPVLQNAAASAQLFGFTMPDSPSPDGYITAGEPLMLGNDLLEVRFTPGHSPGSIVFYSAAYGWVISGDVLFYQSIGRSDLPGGNHETLLQSIRTEMFSLPDATKVFPGHGPATTIGFEKAHNPFMKD